MRRARTLALVLSLVMIPCALPAEVIDRVVCVVDDDAIFLSDLQTRARPFLAEVEASGATGDALAQQRREALRTTLDRMIDDALVRRAATRNHVTVNTEEVDEFIQRVAQQRGATPEQVYAALAQEGVSRAEYRSHMESEVLQLKVLQLRVRGRINITDSDLQEAYRRAIRENTQGSVMHAAHVMIAVPEDATPAQLVTLRARAEDVARRARAGEDFGAIARQVSDDVSTREQGGDLGELQPGTLPESLDHVLNGLQPGQVSDPVQGPGGFHVIRLESRRTAEPPPFSEVRDRIYAALLNREMLRQQRIYLRELRRAAAIDDRLTVAPPQVTGDPPR